MKFNFEDKTIDREMAEELDMTIWQGNENWFASERNNRDSKLYGYVFTIIN